MHDCQLQVEMNSHDYNLGLSGGWQGRVLHMLLTVLQVLIHEG
jgi:hypothetical protein